MRIRLQGIYRPGCALLLAAILANPAAACDSVPSSACTIDVPSGVPTIEGAIIVAVDGDVICVEAGTYFDNLLITEDITLCGDNGATIDGSTAAAPTLTVFGAGDVVIDGFTITNGSGLSGGGLFIINSGVEILDSEITGNDAVGASGDGGGMLIRSSAVTIEDSTISGNTAADNGGGIYADAGGMLDEFGVPVESAVTLVRISVTNNDAVDGGGGYFVDSTLTVSDSIVADNDASDDGGGFFLDLVSGAPSALVSSSTFTNNNADDDGGGMWIDDSSVTILDSIVWANSATTGDALDISAGSAVTVDDTDIDPGEIDGPVFLGLGVVTLTPDFVDPAPLGNYHLAGTSPLIDLVASTATGFDIDRDTRVMDGDGDGTADLDMGADEVCPFLPGDANDDGSVSLADASFILDYLFNGGLAPDPLAVADVNGDGSVSLADPSVLLAHLFAGGDPPVCRP